MEKKALLGTGIMTALKAGKKAFSAGNKNTKLSTRIGKGTDAGVASMANKIGVKGNLGGMLSKGKDGATTGLSNRGKVSALVGGGAAAGYVAG